MLNNQPSSHEKRIITNATHLDQQAITQFLRQNHRIHRHLDWFNTIEWIGEKPFLIERNQQGIEAVFLAVPEVPEATWVRLFCIRNSQSIETSWDRLLNKTIKILKSMEIKALAALASSQWFLSLLNDWDFKHINTIIALERKVQSVPKVIIESPLEIHPMNEVDLKEITHLDHVAFKPIWQISLSSLHKAFHQQGCATVAVINKKIVGYQISTYLGKQGHLARLAVLPEQQGKNIASALVSDLLVRFAEKNITHITVNTQIDNLPSQAVYSKLGFFKTGETIPVYQRVL
jgi:ribosomal protein S18 acetylase RimI-like enzyme